MIKKLTLLASILIPIIVSADTVLTKDGSTLKGTIVKIKSGKIHLKTSYAGEIKIAKVNVADFSTDNEVNVRLKSGTTIGGKITSKETKLMVESGEGNLESSIDNVTTLWEIGSKDPDFVDISRKWSFEAGVNLSGKTGNSDEFRTGITFEAKNEGPEDRLRIYGKYYHPDTGKDESEDEGKLGTKFTNFFSGNQGWFIGEDLEFNEAKNLKFRSTSSTGMDYQFIDEDDLLLEGSAGLSYRYEDYEESEGDDNLGGTFGINLEWQFAEWAELKSRWVYVPSFQDFDEYIITQSTALDIPLSYADFWKLRMEVNSSYNSNPQDGNEYLDTNYETSLILSFK